MSLQRHVPGRQGSGHLIAGSTELGQLLHEKHDKREKHLSVEDLQRELSVFADGDLAKALKLVVADIRSQMKIDLREALQEEMEQLRQQLTTTVTTLTSERERTATEVFQVRDHRRSRRISSAGMPPTLQRTDSPDRDGGERKASDDLRFETDTNYREPASPKSVNFERQPSMHRRKSFALSIKGYDADGWEERSTSNHSKKDAQSPTPRHKMRYNRSSMSETTMPSTHDRSYHPLMALSTVISEPGQGEQATPHSPTRPGTAREVCCHCFGMTKREPIAIETASDLTQRENFDWDEGLEDMVLDKRVSCHERVHALVESTSFEYFTGVLVVLNALALGLEVDCAVNPCDPNFTPALFNAVDGTFCLFFVCEISLRLHAYGRSYFSRRDWQWNIFDFFMVCVQLVDQARYWLNADSWVGTNFILGRTLRLIRLVRVARIYRVIRLFKELHVIVSSMASAAGSLVWSLLLQVVTVYVWGLIFLQIVSASEDYMHDEHLQYWFGSLGRSMLTMFECVLSGVSWDSIVSPLMRDVSPIMGVIFVMYIAVSLFAMMNLVTGLFVAEVTNKVREDKDESLAESIRELFRHLGKDDDDGPGNVVTREEFLSNLQSEAMQTYLKSLDVHPSEASLLFDVLDVDGDLLLKRDEMLNAFLRLRGPAKALDIAILRRELADIIQGFGGDGDDMGSNGMQGIGSFAELSNPVRSSWHSPYGAPLLLPPADHRILSAGTHSQESRHLTQSQTLTAQVSV
mmetsp:Transcript_49487/g.115752  ORF Transcript_49487/g.115752 Transcript_49487/m.115752 type:complete len:747 (+) Transcript_49487:94-2334(+)